jgi:iron complex transport system substrate-binding protein
LVNDGFQQIMNVLRIRAMRAAWAALALSGGLVVHPALAASATRVASLAPSLTELACELGFASNLVGRSSACDFPPAVAAVPVVGDFGRPTQEALLAARPDLLLLTDVEQPAALDAARAAGLRVRVLPCESWAGLEQAALVLAAELGDPARGSNWVTRLQARRTTLAARVAAAGRARPRLFVEVWGEPLTTAGRDAFLSDVITLAGAEPVGRALAGTYLTVSTEWVIAQQPEVILLTYMPASSAPDTAALARRIGWAGMPALRRNAVIRDVPTDLLLRPGPRLIEGAEQLADALLRLAR